jgi:hypothetical protein
MTTWQPMTDEDVEWVNNPAKQKISNEISNTRFN